MSDQKHHPIPCEITVALHEIARLIRKRLEEQICDLPLSEAQWRVIGFLSIGNTLTQTELAELLGMQKAPLGEIIDRLESKGLVYRESSSTDRRSNYVYLTEEAQRLATHIRQRFAQLRDIWQHTIGSQRWQELQSVLYHMAEQLCRTGTKQKLFSPTQSDASHLVGIIVRSLRREYEHETSPEGITWSHWLLINAVISKPGINQSELAALLDINKVPLGKLLDQLESIGWLKREKDKHDRRVKRLFIETDNAFFQSSREAFSTYNERFIGHLSARKRNHFINTLIIWRQCLIEQSRKQSKIHTEVDYEQ